MHCGVATIQDMARLFSLTFAACVLVSCAGEKSESDAAGQGKGELPIPQLAKSFDEPAAQLVADHKSWVEGILAVPL